LGLFALATFALVGGARPARAEGRTDPAALPLLTLMGVDVALTLTDVIRPIARQEPSRLYGAVELALTAPQVALYAAMLNSPRFAPPGDADARRTYFALMAWTGLLAIHGLATLVHPTRPPLDEGPSVMAPVASLDVAPTLMGAGRDRVSPGLALAGRF